MSHTNGPVTAGIDIGTTSVKAVAADPEGRILARVRVPHPVVASAADRLEHDADRAWRRGPRRALSQLTKALGAEPDAVALSTMVPSLTAVDKKGRPMTPGLLYGDARGRTGGVEKTALSDAGEVLGFLRWTAASAPDAAGYWSAPAVANYALAGQPVIDIGTAFTSMPLYGGRGWDEDLLAGAGVRSDQMPRVENMGTAIGHVTGQSGTTLAAGCVDGMCEQIVGGADEEGDVLVLCGTTLITWIVTSAPVEVPNLWGVPHTTPNRWVIGGPSNAGGLFQDAVARLIRPGPAEPTSPDDIPVWAPYIRGERTPLHDIHRRAELHGLTLTHGPAAVRRAAFEAAGFVVRHHIDLAGQPTTRIVAVGGGTRVDEWMHALADTTGLSVHVAAVPEGAALGAAFLGRMALGLETGLDGARAWARTGRIVDPEPAWQKAAEDRYAVFRALADRALP